MTEHKCDTCDGIGTIDETLGGIPTSNPAAKCPDCDGNGFWVKAKTSDELPAECERCKFLENELKDVLDLKEFKGPTALAGVVWERDQLKQQLTAANEELEDERMRHAACGVIAMANTRESAAQQRQMLPKYWSASVQDVARAVDEQMRLREELAKREGEIARLRKVVERLGSMEAFTVSHGVDKYRDTELLSRIDYARAALTQAQSQGSEENKS